MNAETFIERKTKLEEFYKQRIKFNINSIYIIQTDARICIYEDMADIFFKTFVSFKRDKILICNFLKHLKPIISYAYSYTIQRKHIKDDFILKEFKNTINFNYESVNNELYIKNLKIVLSTYYDFSHVDYDFYFWVLSKLEENNELIVSHIEPIEPIEPIAEDEKETDEEPKIINPFKIFKSDECIICMVNKPNILFCNCGHLCYCTECYKLKSLSACPICKTENEIIRTLE